MKKQLLSGLVFLGSLIDPLFALAAPPLNVGDKAPVFSASAHDGAAFNLEARRGKWTVLFFYPKADTPGCTKQACAFRDNIKKITGLGADVFGISVNSVADQAAFHAKHRMSFALLADPKGEITSQYGTKMPLINMSNRWTFIIDPELKVRSIRKNVDPLTDAQQVADEITKFKSAL